MLSIEKEKNDLEKSLIEENEQKESVLKILHHTESTALVLVLMNKFLIDFFKETFHQERDLLLKEINILKKQKLDLEENLSEKTVQLNKLKEKMDKHQFDYNEYTKTFSKTEIQV